ncbi:hypothetical protein SAMN05421800_102111 [Chryseobacterium balustinum]|uniref:Uncharacterized protein n=1 Tax=Chryseobacterium balustinum TaxID=246 RepID=A0ABY1L4U7_9FLAO|nr:hypothetical protein SAMN05421800_102111 [Chryseobacterium balustinum]
MIFIVKLKKNVNPQRNNLENPKLAKNKYSLLNLNS